MNNAYRDSVTSNVHLYFILKYDGKRIILGENIKINILNIFFGNGLRINFKVKGTFMLKMKN